MLTADNLPIYLFVSSCCVKHIIETWAHGLGDGNRYGIKEAMIGQ